MVENWNQIWVELRFLGRKSLFELRENGRPLGIGSGLCNDLRISDAKVALVHCELERTGDSIRLVPTGYADVRLNAAHVGASCTVPSRGLIEFLDYEIEVVLHKVLPSYASFNACDDSLEEPPPATLPSPQSFD